MERRHIAHARGLKGHNTLKQRPEPVAIVSETRDSPKQPENSDPSEHSDQSDQELHQGSESESSDSESEILAQLQKLRDTKPKLLKQKQSWRNSVIKKQSKSRQLAIVNDATHSDAHREFLDKFVK